MGVRVCVCFESFDSLLLAGRSHQTFFLREFRRKKTDPQKWVALSAKRGPLQGTDPLSALLP